MRKIGILKDTISNIHAHRNMLPVGELVQFGQKHINNAKEASQFDFKGKLTSGFTGLFDLQEDFGKSAARHLLPLVASAVPGGAVAVAGLNLAIDFVEGQSDKGAASKKEASIPQKLIARVGRYFSSDERRKTIQEGMGEHFVEEAKKNGQTITKDQVFDGAISKKEDLVQLAINIFEMDKLKATFGGQAHEMSARAKNFLGNAVATLSEQVGESGFHSNLEKTLISDLLGKSENGKLSGRDVLSAREESIKEARKNGHELDDDDYQKPQPSARG